MSEYAAIERRARVRERIVTVLTYIMLILWAVMVLFPFYWMILTSVKSYGAYNSEYTPAFFTLSPTFQNYRDAFTAVPLGKYLLNTLIYTASATAIMLIVIGFTARLAGKRAK